MKELNNKDGSLVELSKEDTENSFGELKGTDKKNEKSNNGKEELIEEEDKFNKGNKEKEEGKFEPIIFINKPVYDLDNDIIGFSTQVSILKEAIEKGARMIGIIADYGSGKSSLTELLNKQINHGENEKSYNMININMWDSLDNEKGKDTSEINSLTKSFLFQLSLEGDRKGNKFANYINRLISKNYNVLSFSTNFKYLWIYLTGIISFYALYMIFNNESILNKRVFGSHVGWLSFFYGIAPLFLVIAIIIVVKLLWSVTIVFSNWKRQDNRSEEVNDLFSAYRIIIDKLNESKNIIMIEDLDRIESKKIIVSFLKELYRFQNLLSEKEKDNFTFIVSIKPEVMLSEFDDSDELSNLDSSKSIYTKVFDLVLHLKPIHYEDYEAVLLQLIKNNPEEKIRLEELLSTNSKTVKIGSILPNELRWLISGQNLTIRDLKDRLNYAVSTMIILKNKDYKGISSINFETCSAVAYLESRYPYEYGHLVKDEKKFGEIIIESYEIRNNSNGKEETEENLKSALETKFPFIGNIQDKEYQFVKDLIKMILENTLDDDFRMYFYTYPNGSYIKTTDEKIVYDYLLLPETYSYENTIDENVNRIISSGSSFLDEAILQFGNREIMPKVVLFNSRLLERAIDCNGEATFDVFCQYCQFENDIDEESKKIILALNNVQNNSTRTSFFKSVIRELSKDIYETENVNAKIKIRLNLIDLLSSHRKIINELYINEDIDLPIISKGEIEKIDNPEISLDIIGRSTLTVDSVEDIMESLNLMDLEDSACDDVIVIYQDIIADETLVDEKTEIDFSNRVLEFLMKNKIINNDLFAYIMGNHDNQEKEISEYINAMNLYDMNSLNRESINETLGLAEYLSDEVINQMKGCGFLTLYIYNRYLKEKTDEIDFDNHEYYELIQVAMESIYSYDDKGFNILRERISRASNDALKSYNSLFFGIYPLITFQELINIDDFRLGLSFINDDKIVNNQRSIAQYIENEFVNSEVLFEKENGTDSELMEIIKRFFLIDSEDDSQEIDINEEERLENIRNFFYELSFDGVEFGKLSSNEANDFYVIIKDCLKINDFESIKEFIVHVHYLFDQCDQDLQGILEEKKYIDFVNSLDMYSNITIEYIDKAKNLYQLSSKITEKCLESELYEIYIYSKTLNDDALMFDIDKIPINEYIYVYCKYDKLFIVMSNNNDFLKYIMDNEKYIDFDFKHLEPMFKLNQKIEFIKYLFSIAIVSEKYIYLRAFGKFETINDSKEFQKFICSDENIELLEDGEIDNHIYHNLWEDDSTHKGQYRKLWNKRWKTDKE